MLKLEKRTGRLNLGGQRDVELAAVNDAARRESCRVGQIDQMQAVVLAQRERRDKQLWLQFSQLRSRSSKYGARRHLRVRADEVSQVVCERRVGVDNERAPVLMLDASPHRVTTA